MPKGKTKYVTRFKSKGRSGGRGGGWKSMLAPLIGGVADNILAKVIPVQGVGATVTGFLLHDHATRQIGLYQLGHSAANYIPIIGGGGGSIGGGY